MLGAVALACLVCAASCGSDDDRAPVLGGAAGGAPDDASAALDAGAETEVVPGPDADGDAREPDGEDDSAQQIVAPETHGTIDLPFSVDAAGSGVQRVKQIEVVANQGGVEFNGVAHVGFVYQSHDWGAAGYELYDVVSIPQDGSDFAVSYLYCQTGSLPYVYSESFSQPMAWENASGTCAGVVQPTTTQVDLPALKARPAFLDTGITVSAPGLTLSTTDGRATLGGNDYDLVPFNTVDCSTCPGGPWVELHAMLFADSEACFGIVYLFPDEPATIQLDHVVCLPGLERTYAKYDGSWAGTLKSALRHKVPFRPRPPVR